MIVAAESENSPPGEAASVVRHRSIRPDGAPPDGVRADSHVCPAISRRAASLPVVTTHPLHKPIEMKHLEKRMPCHDSATRTPKQDTQTRPTNAWLPHGHAAADLGGQHSFVPRVCERLPHDIPELLP